MRLTACAAAVIALTACGQQDSTGAPEADVLQVMSLHESGAGRVSFAAVTEQGSAVVFNDVRFAVGQEAVTAETLRLEGARLENGAPRFASLTLQNVALPAAIGASGRIDRIVLEEPSPAASGVVAALFREDQGFAAAFAGVEPREVTFDLLALTGLSVSADTTEGEASLSLAEARIDSLDAQRMDAFTLTGVDLAAASDDGPVSLSLASAVLNGLDSSMFQVIADALGEVENADEEALAQAVLTSAVFTNVYAKRFDDYAVTDFTANIAGARLAAPTLTGAVREQNGLFVSETAAQLSLAADAEAGAAGAQLAQGLSLLGYDALDLTVRAAAKADPAQDRVSTDDYVITLDDGFQLDLAYDFSGVQEYTDAAAAMALELDESEADPAAVDPATVVAMYAPLVLHGLGVTLTDDGFTDRAFAAAAASSGQAEEDVRAQASASLLFLPALAPTPALQTLAQDVAGALGAFIAEPGAVSIALRPEAPLRVGDVTQQLQSGEVDIDAVVTSLGARVSYEAPALAPAEDDEE